MGKIHTIWMTLAALLLLTWGGITASAQDFEDAGCAVTPEQILGQANVRYDGAANVRYDGAGEDGTPIDTLDVEDTPILTDLQYATAGNNAVGLIVVDDFSTVDPDEDQDDEIGWGEASHGWLVLEVVERVIATLPQAAQDLITLEMLDLAGDAEYRSDNIAVELEALMDTMNSAEGIDTFVVNLSFVFVACVDEGAGFTHANWLRDRDDDPDLTLVEEAGGTVADVVETITDPDVDLVDPDTFSGSSGLGGNSGGNSGNNSNNQGSVGQPAAVQQKLAFLRLFNLPNTNNDPLRKLFRDQPYTIVAVASAGNLRAERAFFPARWNEVLAVGATMGDLDTMWPSSNSGDVVAPGAFFWFDDEQYRAGTSFAAPVVSVMVAVEQTQNNPSCGVSNNGRFDMSGNGNQFNNTPLLDVANDC